MHLYHHKPHPRVTVVVPTYNRRELVVPTIESVRNQTLTDWECIVVDDGSTDDTRQVVEAIAAIDPRVRYVWQENSSASHARNHGLRLAAGDYIVFLDSDDLFTADRLAWQVEAMDAQAEAVMAYGDTFKFYHDSPGEGFLYCEEVKEMPCGDAFEALLANNTIYSPLIRTAAIRQVGGFDTSMASAEDWEMWVSLSKRGKLIYQPRVALRYRIHRGNKSSNTLRNYRCASYVVEKHTRELPAGQRRRLRRAARRYFQQGYTMRMLDLLRDQVRQRRWGDARETFATLARLNPLATSRHLSRALIRILVGKLLAGPIRLAERLVATSGGIRWIARDLAGEGPAGSKIDLGQIRQILVLRPDEIGDVVMTSAFLRELRRTAPQAKITAVVSPLAATLLEACPYIDEVIGIKWNERGRLGRFRRYRQARRLAERELQPAKFDLAILPRFDCDDYYSTPLAYMSGARHRVAFSERSTDTRRQRNQGYDRLITMPLRDHTVKHDVQRSLDIIRHLGGSIAEEHLEVWTTPEDEAVISQLLTEQGHDARRPLIAMAPGAGAPKRQWPVEQYAALCAWLIESCGACVAVIGGPGEEQLGAAICHGRGSRAINLVGLCTLRQTVAVLRHCTLYIGNDSGPMHMAAAAGLPVVELSCHPQAASQAHANSPARFSPWGVESMILRPPAPLAPCHDGCEAQTAHCICQISIESVKEAALAILPVPLPAHP